MNLVISFYYRSANPTDVLSFICFDNDVRNKVANLLHQENIFLKNKSEFVYEEREWELEKIAAGSNGQELLFSSTIS